MKTKLSAPNTAMCCRRFQLQKSPQEIRKMYDDWVEATTKCKLDQTITMEEIYLIYPMLEYLGYFKMIATGAEDNNYYHHYSCKMLNKETGECSVYDIRPKMCRSYAVHHPCDYKDCLSHHFCSGIREHKELMQESLKEHRERCGCKGLKPYGAEVEKKEELADERKAEAANDCCVRSGD